MNTIYTGNHPLPKCRACNRRVQPGERPDCPHGFPAPPRAPKLLRRERAPEEDALIKAADRVLDVARRCMGVEQLSTALRGLEKARRMYADFEEVQVFDAQVMRDTMEIAAPVEL